MSNTFFQAGGEKFSRGLGPPAPPSYLVYLC